MTPTCFPSVPSGDCGVTEVSPDAQFVLGDEELEFRWSFAWLPVAVVANVLPDEAACIEFLCRSGHGETTPDVERERFATVRAWIAGCGGVDEAFLQSPPIVIERAGCLRLFDGWHRLQVAASEGKTHTWVLLIHEP